MTATRCIDIFVACVEAINQVKLMDRTREDKEFHFQKWFTERLNESKISFDPLKRNSHPDYVLPSLPEGYEVKGLAYPGRDASFDCNSQVPKGFHNERAIFYVFGRYPNWEDGKKQLGLTQLADWC